jgi:hypothetical protein
MGIRKKRTKIKRSTNTFLKMELTILTVQRDRRGELEADLPIENLQSGDYSLVKIETLNDRIEVEEFIESLKNK